MDGPVKSPITSVGSTRSHSVGIGKDKNSNVPHGSSVKSITSGGGGGGGSGGESSKSMTTTTGSSTKSNKRNNSQKERIERERMIKILEAKKEKIQNTIRNEKIAMLCFACIAVIFAVLWLFAVGTDYWYYVHESEEVLSTHNSSAGKLFVSGNAGLWRICHKVRKNGSDEQHCKTFDFIPENEDFKKSEGTSDREVSAFMKTEVTFAIISLLLMVMATPIAFYTFKNTRYMFKRLASGLYFFSSATVFVVMQVTDAKIRYEKEIVKFIHPRATFSYGFCYYTGWAVLVMYFVNAVVFLWCSRKRKGDKALDDDTDEAQIMGR